MGTRAASCVEQVKAAVRISTCTSTAVAGAHSHSCSRSLAYEGEQRRTELAGLDPLAAKRLDLAALCNLDLLERFRVHRDTVAHGSCMWEPGQRVTICSRRTYVPSNAVPSGSLNRAIAVSRPWTTILPVKDTVTHCSGVGVRGGSGVGVDIGVGKGVRVGERPGEGGRGGRGGGGGGGG